MTNYQFKLVTTPEEIAAYFALRHEIFVKEQQIFQESDLDDIDAIAYPIIAVASRQDSDGLEPIVGVVRIYETKPGFWYGGRLGTGRDYRKGWQIGKGLIHKAVATANTWGCEQFLATVQLQNVRFFQRLHWQSLKETTICDLPHHYNASRFRFLSSDYRVASYFAFSKSSLLMLPTLVAHLQKSIGILHKQDIQIAASALSQQPASGIRLGDDCAAIPDGDDYLLLASEGMMPFFVDHDPWFAGWSAVMVNVSDIYAMGGRPIAIVDALWSQSIEESQQLWAGMKAAAQAYNVPIVGGHTNCHSPYNALSVSILGRAKRLITSFDAQPGHQLLMAIDLKGQVHPKYAFWNAATEVTPSRLQENLALLPYLAETGICKAGKDISMGGVIGTTLMLLETSRGGAVLNLDAIPCPANVLLETWLTAFPSYGFLLSVDPDHVPKIQALFHDRQLVCEVIGEVNSTSSLVLRSQQDSVCFWDLKQRSLTGFSTALRE